MKLSLIRWLYSFEDRKIVVDWKFVGLTKFGMAIRYIPDKLWNRVNMDLAAKTWHEGVSTFYLGEDPKITKFVIEKSHSRTRIRLCQR